jgi:hypothetical protein
MSQIEQVLGFRHVEPLPGADTLTTEAGKEIAARPQFKGGIGHHVYVNGYDLARVEAEAFERGRKAAAIADEYARLEADGSESGATPLLAEIDELRRALAYLWTATGFRGGNLAVRDLFADDDPLVADVQRLIDKAFRDDREADRRDALAALPHSHRTALSESGGSE